MNSLLEFVKSVCVQTAVHWPNPSPVDAFNNLEFDDPQEIKIRWDGKNELITDDQGNQIVSTAEILVSPDNDDVKVGEYLYLGELVDLTSDQEDDPMSVNGAYRIKQTQSTPLFRSTDEFVTVVYI